MADVSMKVSMDTKDAVQSTTALDEALKKMGLAGDVGKTFMSGLWKEVFGGITVANLASKAVHEFTDFIKDSVDAAGKAELAEANLKSALGITGREVNLNAQHFIDYAKSLQKATIYDDEAVKGCQALLIQLTNLDQQGIDRATRGAIGLASVLGIDLQSAAMLVTKAMEGNTAALGRYGIKVSETGTAEEKRQELLTKLEGMYKRATDATGTFAGKQAQLKNNLDELKETIGKSIIENERLQKVVADLSLGFQYLSEHGGALKKVVDGIFQGFLGPGGMLVLKLLGGLADKQRELNKETENYKQWGETLNMSLIAIAKSGTDLTKVPILKFFVDLARGTKEGAAAFIVTEEEAKKLGITLRSQVIEQIKDTEEALRKLKATGEATPGAIEALNKKIKDLTQYLTGAKTAATHCGIELAKTLVPAARDLNKEFAKTPVVIDLVFKEGMPKWIKAIKDFIDKYKKEIDAMLAITRLAIGITNTAWNNYYIARTNEIESEQKKKQEALDADYERRKKDIEDSMLSETEKQAALELLDKEYAYRKETAEKEYEAKKRALQKEAGERQKAGAIVQAVINVAEAVTKAWALGPIIGPILAGLAVAMGAIQIALIKSQAIPLAKGAMFDRPTLLAGGRYELGDKGLEAALPVEPLMKRIEAAILRGMAAKGQGATVHVYIGQEELDKRIIKTVKREGDLGRLKMASKTVS